MSHGQFNFTPSGIEWPMFLHHCCNAFFQCFPHPVHRPLCVIQPSHLDNATACVARKCTADEQGTFAAVAEIECPAAESTIPSASLPPGSAMR